MSCIKSLNTYVTDGNLGVGMALLTYSNRLLIAVVSVLVITSAASAQRADGSAIAYHSLETFTSGDQETVGIKLENVDTGAKLVFFPAKTTDCYFYVSRHQSAELGNGRQDLFATAVSSLRGDTNNRVRFRALWCTRDVMRACFDLDDDHEYDACVQALWYSPATSETNRYKANYSQSGCPEDRDDAIAMTPEAFTALDEIRICSPQEYSQLASWRSEKNTDDFREMGSMIGRMMAKQIKEREQEDQMLASLSNEGECSEDYFADEVGGMQQTRAHAKKCGLNEAQTMVMLRRQAKRLSLSLVGVEVEDCTIEKIFQKADNLPQAYAMALMCGFPDQQAVNLAIEVDWANAYDE